MGEQLSVNPESLIRAGAQFSIESGRLADAVNRLQSSPVSYTHLTLPTKA